MTSPLQHTDEPRPSLLAAYRRNLLVLITVSLGVFVLERLGWLGWLENRALDVVLRASPAERSRLVSIVEINDEDYERVFGSRSPLNPDKLATVLEKIKAGGAAVIGADIDTSSADFRGRHWPEVVWARDAEPVCDEPTPGDEGDDLVPCPGARRFRRLPVLGGDAKEGQPHPGLITTTPPSGLALFPKDADGVIRRYRRAYYSDAVRGASPSAAYKGYVNAFPAEVVRTYEGVIRGMRSRAAGVAGEPGGEGAGARDEAEGEDLILNFTGDRYRFPRMSVSQLLEAAGKESWASESPLKGRIVLLGGTYQSSREIYVTPVGLQYGVMIVAQAIESEWRRSGLRPLNHILSLAIDLAAGLALIFLNWRFRSRFLLLIDLAFIVAVSLAGSYVSFNAFSHWFNFTAVMVSVLIHVLWEKAREGRMVFQENSKLLQRSAELQKALQDAEARLAEYPAKLPAPPDAVTLDIRATGGTDPG